MQDSGQDGTDRGGLSTPLSCPVMWSHGMTDGRRGKDVAKVWAPLLTERDFQIQVTQLAEIRGWSWLHLRPAMTQHSWRTPISGPLGKGWPDLLLVRRERILAVELKRDGGKPTPEQVEVLGLLSGAAETAVWTPLDWPTIERVLR